MSEELLTEKLDRLIAVLERMAPPKPQPVDLDTADCFVWNPDKLAFDPVRKVNRVDISLIRGVDRVRDILFDNT
ncbi:hypothetical protein, partial [Escherichia coli]